MTKEQRDWYEYGKLMCAYKYVKQEEPESVHHIIPMVWDARKKAHRWNATERLCSTCLHRDNPISKKPCRNCDADLNMWEPI